ncbi:MAG: hypothetical protein QXR53_01910 [Candidatus Norongarragalinales archaeon]
MKEVAAKIRALGLEGINPLYEVSPPQKSKTFHSISGIKKMDLHFKSSKEDFVNRAASLVELALGEAGHAQHVECQALSHEGSKNSFYLSLAALTPEGRRRLLDLERKIVHH